MQRLLAALGALAVTALTLTGVVRLNRPPEAPPPREEREPVTFEVAAPPKPPPSRRPPPPPRTPPKAPPPPASLLSASLSGLSFGLAAFDGGALGASDAALGGAGAGDVVMTESTVDELPRPRQRAAPRYPARARARGVEGWVNLSLLVGEDGGVRDVSVLASDPPDVFEDAAREAVRAWRFEPARYQGRAVAIRVQQMLRFTLE